MDSRCAECGAPLPPSGDCWTRLHQLLEIETRVAPTLDPETGKRAHFFAVATYQLQHPSRLQPEALAALRRGVAEMLQPAPRPIEDLRREIGRTVGRVKVGRRAAASDRTHITAAWPTSWPMTAVDVINRPDAEYPQTTATWARATIEALARSG
ncbi:MAG: hypothetical protein KC442_16210 [Thermomicrobiales bacterium]|nr:hypothetical protein [Thermomicrobiales bacterium]